MRKLRETLHWLFNTLIEPIGPVQSTSNGWEIVRNWSPFVNAINKGLSFKEDLLNSLQILLVKFQKCDVLFLKFILNDWSVKETFKGIKKLEFTNDGIAIIKALSKNRS